MKQVLITGITGQDGAYLAEFLLKKGYEVHGIKRRTSLLNTNRIDHLYEDPHQEKRRLVLHYGDMTDSTSLIHVVEKVQPDEVYNLAAQSHVQVSFEEPSTPQTRMPWEPSACWRLFAFSPSPGSALYQASTSEMYGLAQQTPQSEKLPFIPVRPWPQLYAYWITVNYRESYGIYACNGIMFNHESPLRGETFVTRKVTRAMARISLACRRSSTWQS